jgi:hypothetical protein
MKMPNDCRSPMLSVSMMDAPIKMGSVGRRICNSGIVGTGFVGAVIVFCSPIGRDAKAASCN